jgi:hypothetical protein
MRAMAAVLAALALCAAPAPASASGALETILQDDAQLLHRPEDQLRRSLEELKLLGIDRIRVTAGWSVLTRDADSVKRPEFDATDPRAYEQERFRNLDRLLVLAQQYGFRTMVDVAFWAPHWASADPVGERGRTDVDVAEYAKFATAVARRYSGTFVIPQTVAASTGTVLYEPSQDERFLAAQYGTRNADAGSSLHSSLGLPLASRFAPDPLADTLGTGGVKPTLPLPRVDTFTIWNEPNHPSFLRPQWVKEGKRHVPHSPHVYRRMLELSYPAIKGVRPDATVLIGGTSFTGSYRKNGSGGIPPLRFLRELACVDGKLRPLKRSGCKGFVVVPGDGWSHHPYSMEVEPDTPSKVGRPDDVPIAELPRLARTVDRLIAKGRLAPGVRNLWVTEYGYETNPPVKGWIFSEGDQARFLTWAEYIASRTPTVRSFAQFLLRDVPPGPVRVGKSAKRGFGQWQSGILHTDGQTKLGAYHFRAGIFVQRIHGKRLRIYGRLRVGPGPRTVILEQRPESSERWEPLLTVGAVERTPVSDFIADGKGAFMRFAPAPRGRKWRYRLRYLDGDTWRASVPAIRAVER